MYRVVTVHMYVYTKLILNYYKHVQNLKVKQVKYLDMYSILQHFSTYVKNVQSSDSTHDVYTKLILNYYKHVQNLKVKQVKYLDMYSILQHFSTFRLLFAVNSTLFPRCLQQYF